MLKAWSPGWSHQEGEPGEISLSPRGCHLKRTKGALASSPFFLLSGHAVCKLTSYKDHHCYHTHIPTWTQSNWFHSFLNCKLQNCKSKEPFPWQVKSSIHYSIRKITNIQVLIMWISALYVFYLCSDFYSEGLLTAHFLTAQTDLN